jgi:NADH:ubiquinone oxidoreductase subunit 5 (subunit L)/multisubunit Na+/H+ antiporter MnhA subunit
MVPLAFMLPLIGAVVCLRWIVLSPARLTGLGAAGVLFLCTILMIVARLQGLPSTVFDQTWLQWGGWSFRTTLVIDPLGWLLAALIAFYRRSRLASAGVGALRFLPICGALAGCLQP